MQVAEIPANEKDRLKALNEYQILDTLPEQDFDDITRLASEICKTPISTVTLVDMTRQWFKSHHGVSESETHRDFSFCAHAINKPDEMLVVPDAHKDVRFANNPLVTGDMNVTFYAGVPLTNDEGYSLGALCVIDTKPKQLTDQQTDALKVLANQVVKLLELRKKNIQLEKSQQDLEKRNEELNQFAYVVSHDIKSPLNNMIMLSQMLRNEYGAKLDDSGKELLGFLNKSGAQLKEFIDGILLYYRGDMVAMAKKEEIDLAAVIKSIIELVGKPADFTFNYPEKSLFAKVNKVALEQILINLVTNSIKYNDKPKGVIDIDFLQTDDHYVFTVKDNGRGIGQSDTDKIFDVFVNLGQRDRFNNMGTGIGLSSVKKMVEKLGGKLSVKSTLGVGSVFTFTLEK